MNTRPLLLLLCAFCWLLASGCQELSLQKGAESQVYQQYEQGLRLFREKKYPLALKSFLKLHAHRDLHQLFDADVCMRVG